MRADVSSFIPFCPRPELTANAVVSVEYKDLILNFSNSDILFPSQHTSVFPFILIEDRPEANVFHIWPEEGT